MDRAISPDELKVVTWLLDHALVDVTAYRSIQVLRVVGKCRCGCASLYFEPLKRGKSQMLADELAVYPDGQKAGLILWAREGKIAWLEVYDFQPGSSHRVPDVSNLCTWENLGQSRTPSVTWPSIPPKPDKTAENLSPKQ